MTFSDRLADWAARSTPERLRRARWLQPRWPLVGVELRADALVVARLAQGATGTRLAGVARRALPDGLYRGALGEAASDPAALGAALAEALGGALYIGLLARGWLWAEFAIATARGALFLGAAVCLVGPLGANGLALANLGAFAVAALGYAVVCRRAARGE